MRNSFKLLLLSVFFIFNESCKENEIEIPIIDPPMYSNQYAWKETAIKKGNEEWKEIPNGNILRLYTDYKVDADTMFGAYEYNGINANIEINTPSSIYKGFLKKKDSLFLKIPNENGQENSYVSLNCEILSNSEMIIRNKQSDPMVNVKYKR
ncbi:hypothetical protein [Sphingobacterium detergens]|uniref:Uncharacterized protein n=1 Tax=Sphingobacterium detergens TaxID=1145106 RepID=A0A420ADT8_SPHD1|nr:hypothetical protein [Sphingobacterium detergens]RKE42573.1 hypothetical protein DFQ12_5487 [Sphingobacterium detergens]